ITMLIHRRLTSFFARNAMCTRHDPTLCRIVCSLVVAAAATSSPPIAAADQYALLVGVNEYQHAKLRDPSPLKYSMNDVTELNDVLRGAGYTVTLLTDATGKKDKQAAPTKANIEKQL